MIDSTETKKIRDTVQEFFNKMTISVSGIDVKNSSLDEELSMQNNTQENNEIVSVSINLDEPQILIGQGGQTLFETQRVLRMILNKKLQKAFYLDLDINEYKSKKTEFLKNLAKETADQVVATKEEKALSPMTSYERRVIHKELSARVDVKSDSRGDGLDRHIVVSPK